MPILFMSGYPLEELAAHGLPPGIVEVLQKPVPMNELTMAVRRLLDGHGGRGAVTG